MLWFNLQVPQIEVLFVCLPFRHVVEVVAKTWEYFCNDHFPDNVVSHTSLGELWEVTSRSLPGAKHCAVCLCRTVWNPELTRKMNCGLEKTFKLSIFSIWAGTVPAWSCVKRHIFVAISVCNSLCCKDRLGNGVPAQHETDTALVIRSGVLTFSNKRNCNVAGGSRCFFLCLKKKKKENLSNEVHAPFPGRHKLADLPKLESFRRRFSSFHDIYLVFVIPTFRVVAAGQPPLSGVSLLRPVSPQGPTSATLNTLFYMVPPAAVHMQVGVCVQISEFGPVPNCISWRKRKTVFSLPHCGGEICSWTSFLFFDFCSWFYFDLAINRPKSK